MLFDAVVVFAKLPKAGKVKTRLVSSIGAHQAAELYGLFLRCLSFSLRRLSPGLKLFIAVDLPGARRQILRYFPYSKKPSVIGQKGGDLGARMLNATRQVKRRGAKKVLLIGSDCLELSAAHLQKALKLLDRKDIVLGPAQDGGYYLLGWKEPVTACFKGVVWSTAGVLRRTAANVRRLGISLGRLNVLPDVDEARDLRRLPRSLDPRNPATRPLRKLLSEVLSTAKIEDDWNHQGH